MTSGVSSVESGDVLAELDTLLGSIPVIRCPNGLRAGDLMSEKHGGEGWHYNDKTELWYCDEHSNSACDVCPSSSEVHHIGVARSIVEYYAVLDGEVQANSVTAGDCHDSKLIEERLYCSCQLEWDKGDVEVDW